MNKNITVEESGIAPPAITTESHKLPLGVYALGASVFALGTSEFMIAGLVSQISHSLHVSIPAVGNLISLFAMGMLIGAPVMALGTLALAKKKVLLLSTLVFALAHMLTAVIPNFSVILGLRIISAFACATELTVAAAMAISLAGTAKTARAIAIVIGGMTLANVIGVPIGSLIGTELNWQSAFGFIAILSIASAILVALTVPSMPKTHGPDTSLRKLAAMELRSLKQFKVFLALATTVLFEAALFAVYSYVQPILLRESHMQSRIVPWVLFAFGVGTFVGINLGAKMAEKFPLKNIMGSLIALIVMFLLFKLSVHHIWLASICIALIGVCGFSMTAALNTRVIGFAQAAPTLAIAISLCAFNIGNAIGPIIGGIVYAHQPNNPANTIWSGIILAALALLTALYSTYIENLRTIG